MRIVTWNCCRGPYARKVPLLDPLAPDIRVIQECAKPLDDSRHRLWFGENARQGICVEASAAYQLRALPTVADAPKYLVPIEVSGPRSFVLFIVWTLGKQPYPYVEAAARAVDLYRDLIAGSPTLLVGDFNSNTRWDGTHPPTLNHTALVARLADLGLVSAYHHVRGEAHGLESEATYYFHWKKERPYHIDYCFLPFDWAGRIRQVEIGNFEDWRPYSDHRPLLVDVAENGV